MERQTSGGRRMGVTGMKQSSGDRYGRAHHGVASEDTWRHVRHDFATRLCIPHEVTVGIRLVVRRVMGVLGLPSMAVAMMYARVRGIEVGVRGLEMGQECKRRMPPSRMVHEDVR